MHRWNLAYGHAYAYSGQVTPAAEGEMPEIIQRCLDHMNGMEAGEAEAEPEPEPEPEDAQQEQRAKRAKRTKPTPRASYNMALVNWYKDGEDYISPHSDNERQLIPGEPIACFSFGATRNFRLRPKKEIEGGVSADFFLEHGSLVIMGGNCQQTHEHSIPISKRVTRSRVSITLRKFIT